MPYRREGVHPIALDRKPTIDERSLTGQIRLFAYCLSKLGLARQATQWLAAMQVLFLFLYLRQGDDSNSERFWEHAPWDC
jgi:hypothetical protein